MRLRFLASCVALVLVACSHKSAAEPSPPFAAAAAAAAPTPPESSPEERKLVRSAQLELEVQTYSEARARLDRELASAGGYVAQARVDHSDGAVASASLELRIPAPQLDHFLEALAQLGSVLREELHSNEVTQEYYDAEARLRSARQLERRLLEFAGSAASDVKALLEVERELNRVREQIESLQGNLLAFDRRVAFSAVSLQLTSRERIHVGEPPTLGGELVQTLSESSSSLLGAGRALLLSCVALLPWLPLLGLVGYGGRRVLRRRAARAS